MPAPWEEEEPEPPPPANLFDLIGDGGISEEQLPAHIARGLATLILHHGLHHTAITAMIGNISSALSAVKQHLLHDLVVSSDCPFMLQPGTPELSDAAELVRRLKSVIDPKLDIFSGLETTKKQMTFIKKMLPYVEPVPCYLGERAATWIDEVRAGLPAARPTRLVIARSRTLRALASRDARRAPRCVLDRLALADWPVSSSSRLFRRARSTS